MEPHAALSGVKNGDERADILPDPFAPKAPTLARFSAKNLPRLRPAPDPLEIAKGEAAAFLERELGAFHGLTRTFVQRRGKKWKAVTLKRGEPMECERLVDLFSMNFAQRLSPVWHAVAILVEVAAARRAAAAGDVQAAMRHAVLVGESRNALAVKMVKAGEGAAAAGKKKDGHAQRDAKIRAEAADIAEKKPELKSKSAIAGIVKKRLDLDISTRQITTIMKAGS